MTGGGIMTSDVREILVIRRDNIGDLLCTTPMLRALRQRFPVARIAILVNTYNAPAIRGNPDVDEVIVYEKAKHRRTGVSLLSWLWQRLSIVAGLRRRRIDLAILAAPGLQASALRFARLARPRRMIGYGLPAGPGVTALPPEGTRGLHEAEAVFRLLEPLGVAGHPPPPRLVPDGVLAADLGRRIGLPADAGPVVGLHISARKVPQRWPGERFAELAERLLAAGVGRILVFWAPGREDDPLHPGDDGKAEALAANLAGRPVHFVATGRLEELIAGLSLCDAVICADGGAMHVAAALGKPIVCFFGNSDADRWRPWEVPHRLLQKESRDVRDISVEEAVAAYVDLQAALCKEDACAATS